MNCLGQNLCSVVAGFWGWNLLLLRLTDSADGAQDTLLPEELKALLAADHKVNFAISMMSELLHRADLNPVQVSPLPS